MQIVYNAKPNIYSDDTEGHIKHSLIKLGHKVVSEGDGDIYLFHKVFNPPKGFSGLTVGWYFDKVKFNNREAGVKDLIRRSDFFFMTDETWAMQQNNPKIQILRQGIGDRDFSLGKPKAEYIADIGFTGSVYGDRKHFVKDIGAKVFSNVFNRDLFDLCASVKIFVAPEYPSDDYYWSNRVYLTLGSGGFLLHPRLEGLEKEYEDRKHLVFYDDIIDLKEKIRYFLNSPNERFQIQRSGYLKTINDYTYTNRCQELIAGITGIKE